MALHLVLWGLFSLLFAFCFSWLIANIIPNFVYDHKERREAKRKMEGEGNLFLSALYKLLGTKESSSCDIQDTGILMMNPCLDEVKLLPSFCKKEKTSILTEVKETRDTDFIMKNGKYPLK